MTNVSSRRITQIRGFNSRLLKEAERGMLSEQALQRWIVFLEQLESYGTAASAALPARDEIVEQWAQNRTVPETIAALSVRELNLGTRLDDLLAYHGLRTIGTLVAFLENEGDIAFVDLERIGRTSLTQVKTALLQRFGLTL